MAIAIQGKLGAIYIHQAALFVLRVFPVLRSDETMSVLDSWKYSKPSGHWIQRIRYALTMTEWHSLYLDIDPKRFLIKAWIK